MLRPLNGLPAAGGAEVGKIYGGGRLADTALDVGDRKDLHGEPPDGTRVGHRVP